MITIDACPACGSNHLKPHLQTQDFTTTSEVFTVNVCEKCGMGVTSPRPDNSNLGRYYESPDYVSHSNKPNSIIDYIYLMARRFTLRAKWRLITKISRGKLLLDFGSGTGAFIHFMHQKGFQVTGVEPSASARLASSEQIRSTVQPDLTTAKGPYDIITLWHVLEHLPDLNEKLRDLLSLLKPDGVLIIAVPNINSWESNHYKNFWAALDTPRHLWHFTQQSIQQLAETNGARVVQTLPMKLDAYYVSLLSEKYRRSGVTTLSGMIGAFFAGLRSNFAARTTGEFSSLIYIVRK